MLFLLSFSPSLLLSFSPSLPFNSRPRKANGSGTEEERRFLGKNEFPRVTIAHVTQVRK